MKTATFHTKWSQRAECRMLSNNVLKPGANEQTSLYFQLGGPRSGDSELCLDPILRGLIDPSERSLIQVRYNLYMCGWGPIYDNARGNTLLLWEPGNDE
jgi:hypothetical protein